MKITRGVLQEDIGPGGVSSDSWTNTVENGASLLLMPFGFNGSVTSPSATFDSIALTNIAFINSNCGIDYLAYPHIGALTAAMSWTTNNLQITHSIALHNAQYNTFASKSLTATTDSLAVNTEPNNIIFGILRWAQYPNDANADNSNVLKYTNFTGTRAIKTFWLPASPTGTSTTVNFTMTAGVNAGVILASIRPIRKSSPVSFL